MLTEHFSRDTRGSFNYLRMATVPAANPGKYSYQPFTLVLAEYIPRNRKAERIIYFIDLARWCDGLWWPHARRPFRDSIVVDALTLGAAPKKRRRAKPDAVGRAHRAELIQQARKHWKDVCQANTVGEVWRTRFEQFVDRFTGPRAFSYSAMLRSELRPHWNLSSPGYQLHEFAYLREIVAHPLIPNDIKLPGGELPGVEIVGYMEIDPFVQANAGMKRWAQRVFYLSHEHCRCHFDLKNKKPTATDFHVDGVSQPTSAKGCVRPLLIFPGVPSTPYAGEPVVFHDRCLTNQKQINETGIKEHHHRIAKHLSKSS